MKPALAGALPVQGCSAYKLQGGKEFLTEPPRLRWLLRDAASAKRWRTVFFAVRPKGWALCGRRRCGIAI